MFHSNLIFRTRLKSALVKMLYSVPVGIVLSYLVVHARWIVGAVLLLAGLSKISHLSKFIETIKLTDLIPFRLQREIAYTIVVLECVLGVCLLLGAKVTLTAALASGLFSSFTFVVFINLRGKLLVRSISFPL